MCRAYVKGENAIVLAVSPANSDLATSDGLRMAREVDPAGERTLGVVTKIDIMDRGVNARELLQNTVVKLKHGGSVPLREGLSRRPGCPLGLTLGPARGSCAGWIGVVNRAQADINSGMRMGEARAKEMEYFRAHPEYADLDNVGTDKARSAVFRLPATPGCLPWSDCPSPLGLAGVGRRCFRSRYHPELVGLALLWDRDPLLPVTRAVAGRSWRTSCPRTSSTPSSGRSRTLPTRWPTASPSSRSVVHGSETGSSSARARPFASSVPALGARSRHAREQLLCSSSRPPTCSGRT